MLFSEKIRSFNRFQASAWHFIFSGILLLVLIAFMAFTWFPGMLFLYDGGIQGLKILLPVDLILGPLLTLIIFNPKKKELKTDLSIILVLQLLALSWGLHQVYQVRTSHIVFFEGTFYSIKPDQLRDNQKALELTTQEKIPPAPTVPWYMPPKLVQLSAPESDQEKAERFFKQFSDGRMILDYRLYEDISTNPPAPETYDAIFRYVDATVVFEKNALLSNVQAKRDYSFIELLMM